MIFNNPSRLTKIDIWAPKYSTKHKTGKWVVLLARYRVDSASPWILIEFTRAKHLKGQRYCVRQRDAQDSPLEDNGKIPCYAVSMDKLESWGTVTEVKEAIASFGW